MESNESEHETDEIRILQQKHRKEKKELQGKLQALKKSASKGDKKKKKEVTEEIARLEANMKNKHDNEVMELNSNTLVEPEKVIDTPNEETNIRISKAQKRRDRKVNEQKERELRILAQEVDNLHGPRHLETKEIKRILKERNLMISQIPSDGDCLYNAVIKRILELGGTCPAMKELRFQSAELLRKNPDEFLPYLCHPDTGNTLNEAQYAEYCDEVEKKAWGGQVELRALSHVLKRPLEVIQAESSPVEFGLEYLEKESNKITVTYHRYIYSLGKHYNTVTELKEEEGEEKEEFI